GGTGATSRTHDHHPAIAGTSGRASVAAAADGADCRGAAGAHPPATPRRLHDDGDRRRAVSAVAAVEAQPDVGSSEAYAARLYERHSQAIFRLCLKHLRRREDADDAVQTTFIYALLSLRRGVVPQMELPWLLTIARNVCSTRRRSGTRRGTYESPQDLDSIQEKLPTPER